MTLTRSQIKAAISNNITDPLNRQNTAEVVRDQLDVIIDNVFNLAEDDFEDTDLEFDLTPTEDSLNPVTSNGIFEALLLKQDELTFDNTPTNDSANPVTSDGIYEADLLLLPLDGSRAMTGNLALGGNNISGVGSLTVTTSASISGTSGDTTTQFGLAATGVGVLYSDVSDNALYGFTINSSGFGIKGGTLTGYNAYLDTTNLASHQTFLFPATGGTLAKTSDISALSSVYQPLNTKLTNFAALANASGVLTNDGSGNYTWGVGGPTKATEAEILAHTDDSKYTTALGLKKHTMMTKLNMYSNFSI